MRLSNEQVLEALIRYLDLYLGQRVTQEQLRYYFEKEQQVKVQEAEKWSLRRQSCL